MNTNMHINKIGTHDGTFHEDDVFSVALLLTVFGDKVEVIRSRDPAVLDACDIVLDVGQKYDGVRYFDHHMANAPVRPDSVPYSAAGLIWKAYGHDYINTVCKEYDQEQKDRFYDGIWKKFVNPIDHMDNGLNINYDTSTLRMVSAAFAPSWKISNPENQYSRFLEAVKYMQMLMNVEIMRIAKQLDGEDAKSLVEICLQKSKKNEELERLKIIELDQWMPSKKYLWDTDRNFIICQRDNGQWMLECVSPELGSYDQKIPLPKELGGLEKEALQKASGLSDAIFCHKARFLAILGSRESCLKLAEMATHDFMMSSMSDLAEKFNR